MTLFQRYGIFFFGIVAQTAGIALVVKGQLGTSPISSVPYALSLIMPLTFGQTTLAVNILFLLGQIVLLGRKFHKVQFLQAPVNVIVASFIDFFMALFANVMPTDYVWKMALLLIGTTLIAFGVAMQVIANVLMLSGEGIVYAITQTFHFDFGKVKTVFDCSFVLTGVTLCLIYLPSIEGVREGTLISAVVTGYIARWFIHHLNYVDDKGIMHFRIGGEKI